MGNSESLTTDTRPDTYKQEELAGYYTNTRFAKIPGREQETTTFGLIQTLNINNQTVMRKRLTFNQGKMFIKSIENKDMRLKFPSDYFIQLIDYDSGAGHGGAYRYYIDW